MKRLTCALATLAMLMLICIPAQAEFGGTLQGNQPWTLEVDNSNNPVAAGVTIFYLGGKSVDFEIHTVPSTELVAFNVSKMPRGTTRVIIEVDPGLGGFIGGPFEVPVRVIQGAAVPLVVRGPGRLVFDVV